jgi:hypothetical protein
MNKLLLLLCVIVSFTCRGQRRIDRIEMCYVNRYITTISAISCSRFDTVFFRNKKEAIIHDADTIELFGKYIDGLRWQKRANGINVRMKMYVHYVDGSLQEICADVFGVFSINGRTSRPHKKLKNLIDQYWK